MAVVPVLLPSQRISLENVAKEKPTKIALITVRENLVMRVVMRQPTPLLVAKSQKHG